MARSPAAILGHPLAGAAMQIRRTDYAALACLIALGAGLAYAYLALCG